MISQTSTDPIAGLQRKLLASGGSAWCHRWCGTPILWDPHRQVLLTELLLLGPETCQFAACFKHLSAGNPSKTFFSPVGHFPTASASASPAGAGCVPLSQVYGPTPGPGLGCFPPAGCLRADATEVPPPPSGSPPAPPSVLLPLRQPPRHPQCRRSPAHRSRAATRVGGDGARLLMCNWHRHLSPAREERGRGGSGAGAEARPGPGRCCLRGRRVGTQCRP